MVLLTPTGWWQRPVKSPAARVLLAPTENMPDTVSRRFILPLPSAHSLPAPPSARRSAPHASLSHTGDQGGKLPAAGRQTPAATDRLSRCAVTDFPRHMTLCLETSPLPSAAIFGRPPPPLSTAVNSSVLVTSVDVTEAGKPDCVWMFGGERPRRKLKTQNNHTPVPRLTRPQLHRESEVRTYEMARLRR
jgi:hypothetical protein